MANILQLKIQLYGITPSIWRRVLVSDFWTFDKLHKIIQKSMGWEDYHLFEFKFGNMKIVAPDEGYLEENELDPKKVKIGHFINKEKQKFTYIYDFGDCWKHIISVEKILPDEIENSTDYPKCVAGKRACPPEDCGGIGGYGRILELLKTGKDPWGDNPKEFKAWLGNWKPEEFDLNKINKLLK